MDEARAGIGGSREERHNLWRHHVEKVEQEGISIRRYCREQGLSEVSFHYWRRKFRQGSTESKDQVLVPSSPFTRIRLSGETFTSSIRMVLGQGVVLFFEREPSVVWLRELAAVLGDRS